MGTERAQAPPRPTLRFAPSPNGPLHEGHALSARLNRDMARALGGVFLIRVEDIDRVRCTPELCERALRDLAAIGVVSDGPVWRQSERTERYRAALDRLAAAGLAYPARLSRRELARAVEEAERRGAAWPRDPDGVPHYPPAERDAWRERLERSGAPPGADAADADGAAWRLDWERALKRLAAPPDWTEVDAQWGAPVRARAEPERWSDPVLWRRDGAPAYHLAVTVDDAAQGITHVVRGVDLREATAIHRALQGLLGLPEPLYHHHALLRDAAGRKLSKRDGDGLTRPLGGVTA